MNFSKLLKLKTLLILLLAVSLAIPSVVAAYSDIEGFDRNALAATGVMLKGGHQWCSGWVEGRVFDSKGRVGYKYVTARHCLSQLNDFKVAFSLKSGSVAYDVLPDSIRISQKYDVGEMTLRADDMDFSPVQVGDERKLSVGANLLNIAYPVSYPYGVGKIIQYGPFVAPRMETEDGAWEANYHWHVLMPLRFFALGGSSGSPIFSEKLHRVVGIIVGSYFGVEVAVPGSAIQEFLNDKSDSDDIGWEAKIPVEEQ